MLVKQNSNNKTVPLCNRARASHLLYKIRLICTLSAGRGGGGGGGGGVGVADGHGRITVRQTWQTY